MRAQQQAENQRLAAEAAAQARREIEQQERHQRQAEAQRAQQARLKAQAAEQGAFAAAAEAVAAGLMSPDQGPNGMSAADPTAQALAARIKAAPNGWRRFAAAVRPAWSRMRQVAQADAEAVVARDRDAIRRDRAEIDSIWTKFRVIAISLDPGAVGKTARDGIDYIMAKWRAGKGAPDSRR